MNFLEQLSPVVIIFFVALVLIISFVLLHSSRFQSGKQREKPKWSPARNTAGSLPEHNSDSSPAIVSGEARMHDTMRAVQAQLDGKMRALQVLIAEADRAAARLEAVLKSEENVSAAHAGLRRSPLFNPQSGFIGPPKDSRLTP